MCSGIILGSFRRNMNLQDDNNTLTLSLLPCQPSFSFPARDHLCQLVTWPSPTSFRSLLQDFLPRDSFLDHPIRRSNLCHFNLVSFYCFFLICIMTSVYIICSFSNCLLLFVNFLSFSIPSPCHPTSVPRFVQSGYPLHICCSH